MKHPTYGLITILDAQLGQRFSNYKISPFHLWLPNNRSGTRVTRASRQGMVDNYTATHEVLVGRMIPYVDEDSQYDADDLSKSIDLIIKNWSKCKAPYLTQEVIDTQGEILREQDKNLPATDSNAFWMVVIRRFSVSHREQ